MKLTIRNSLASKLLFFLAGFSLLLVSAVAYLNTKIVEESYARQLKEMVAQKIDFILPTLAVALEQGKIDSVRSQLVLFSGSEAIKSVSLLPKNGEALQVKNGDASRTLFVFSRPLEDPAGAVIGSFKVTVSDKAFREMMTQYYRFLTAIISGYLFIVLILMGLLHRALLPLRKLVQKIEAFNPSRPVPITLDYIGNDEIGMIAMAAGKMSDNIIHHADFMNELNEKIEEGRRHLKEAQQIARMGSWWVDPETYAFEFSDQMYVLLGLDKKDPDIRWQTFVDAIDARDRRAFTHAVESTARNYVPFRLTHQLMNAQGEMLHVLTEGKRSLSKEGRVIVSGISMDVSEQAENREMIERLAFYDPLTMLPNRIMLYERLQKAIKDAKRRKEKVGVLFLDLDRFKNINDTLGHTVGDLLLKEVAERLKRNLRDNDTISRIGGDEFVILVPGVASEADVTVVAKKLTGALQERWDLGDKSFYTTISLGISICPDHSEDVDTLIKYADTAMYRAKEDGRNRYRFYDVDMGEQIAKQLKIEHEMREAVVTMEQFELYFQPKISLRSGAMVGAEALLRWNHPKLGLIFPDDFIPIAENTGMIIQIGEWVMHEAARRIEEWKEQGIVPLRLAVNLSGRQFGNPGLLQQIRKVLEQYDIKPQLLEFEVTESVSMISLEDNLKVLQQLRDLGVGVVIDDFGTGYSSLAYLKQFPVDTLKIDKAFIMGMLTDHDDRTIVESIVSLGKSMKLKIVAEGVETLEHVHLLKKLGVDFAQGYYFSRPVPFAKFNQMYLENLAALKERMVPLRYKSA